MAAHIITINSKNGQQKVIHTGETFGTDVKGHRLAPHEVEELAYNIAWDTFGRNYKSVTCVKKK